MYHNTKSKIEGQEVSQKQWISLLLKIFCKCWHTSFQSLQLYCFLYYLAINMPFRICPWILRMFIWKSIICNAVSFSLKFIAEFIKCFSYSLIYFFLLYIKHTVSAVSRNVLTFSRTSSVENITLSTGEAILSFLFYCFIDETLRLVRRLRRIISLQHTRFWVFIASISFNTNDFIAPR